MTARAPHPVGTISARVVVRLAHFVERRGHDPEALCRSVGLSLVTLLEPDARVPYALAEKLGMSAAELSRDPNIGLHLAEDVSDTRFYDAGVLLMMASPSLGASLERMQRYQRYWGDGERSVLVASSHGLYVRCQLPGATGEYQRHADECALAEIVLGARVLTGQDVLPRVVRFRHAAPPDTREHAALFRCALEFDAAHTELELDRSALDLPLPQANETYRAIFQQQVERALARLPGQSGMTADVRAAAQAALASSDCSLAATATALGVSIRTMQRRLTAEGTSFGELVDALRREMAAAYLDQQMPIQEIAWLLGYAETSAFHHAWKRWTGTTPEQARAARAARTPAD
jgi:AraC-like DNA-binding protein